MKIDLSQINLDQFMVHPHDLNGEVVQLVQCIHIGTEWSSDNLHLRSSVWNNDGELISASYPKFFNFGEKPHLSPIPENLDGSVIVEKLDGSTLIISKYKGEFIIRTRGTVDARRMANGSEIDVLFAKYPKLFDLDSKIETWDFSVITEWCSPSNQIVLRYDEVDFILTAVINHFDYSLRTQSDLNDLAVQLDMKRPITYTFDSVKNLTSGVSSWQGKEGVVLYRRNGQHLMKIKSAQYLFLHRAKSEISSVEKVMDVYLSRMFETDGVAPTYNEFFSYLEKIFDYEIACMARGNISNICDAMKEAEKIIAGMKALVEPLFHVSRKDAAIRIVQAYGSTGRASMAFNLLDRKILGAEAYKKLLFQCLKG
jgi:hypothetical protein